MAKGSCSSCGKTVTVVAKSAPNPVCHACRRLSKGISPDGRIVGGPKRGPGRPKRKGTFGIGTCIGCEVQYIKRHPSAKRCPTCSRRRNGGAGRGSASERGYGIEHRRERERWVPVVRAGRAICWRCGKPIGADAPWDLGHDDDDRTKWRGPEHPECNRATYKRAKTKRLIL